MASQDEGRTVLKGKNGVSGENSHFIYICCRCFFHCQIYGAGFESVKSGVPVPNPANKSGRKIILPCEDCPVHWWRCSSNPGL